MDLKELINRHSQTHAWNKMAHPTPSEYNERCRRDVQPIFDELGLSGIPDFIHLAFQVFIQLGFNAESSKDINVVAHFIAAGSDSADCYEVVEMTRERIREMMLNGELS